MDDIDSADAAPAPGTLTRAVALRARQDGWTPQRQHDFIAALAECGCVSEAAAAVGMTARSAYKLRARPDASAFRQSWDIALDYAIRNLSDAAFSRALHGVTTPVFYRGEQVGERRRFDERLTMFLLRYRDPVRYGAWLDGMEARRHPDGAAIVLANALNVLLDRAHGVMPDPPPADGDDADDDDDDDDAAGGPGAPPPPEPPLSDGPQPPPEPPVDHSNHPDDPHEWARRVRGLINKIRGDPDPDGTADDWQSPIIARQPRVRRR